MPVNLKSSVNCIVVRDTANATLHGNFLITFFLVAFRGMNNETRVF